MASPTDLDKSMTVDEFRAWAAADPRRWQLVDGEPRIVSVAGTRHGAILAETGSMLSHHVAARAPHLTVHAMPAVSPHVNADMNLRVADLAIASTDTDADALVDPILLIEILSADHDREAWVNVWAYATIPSVREILLVHSDAVRARLLRRGSDGHWPATPSIVECDGVLTLDSIGYSGPLAAFYPVAPPAPN